MSLENGMYRLLASISRPDSLDTLVYKNNQMDAYQSKIDSKYDQSTSMKTIEEEYPYGSGKFRPLMCRVVSVRTVDTGNKQSDSYKKIIFKHKNQPKDIGYLYRFDNNYWIAHNSNKFSGATDSLIIRRCNNLLKWKDEYGKINSVPISFDEDGFYLTNEIKQEVDRSNGYRKAIIQRNDITKTLKPNQRFIFGSQCLKLSGSGISDFLNTYTDDDNSPAIIRLTFEYDYINPSDDLVNKIANAYSTAFKININEINKEYNVSEDSYTFTATVYRNNDIINPDLIWSINGEMVDYKQEGNVFKVKFLKDGNYNISVKVKNNESLNDNISVVAVAKDTYELRCNPVTDIIYKETPSSFIFTLYKNGVEVNNVNYKFTKIDDLVGYYDFYTDKNKIVITSKRMTNKYLIIECITESFDATPYLLKLKLGGAW